MCEMDKLLFLSHFPTINYIRKDKIRFMTRYSCWLWLGNYWKKHIILQCLALIIESFSSIYSFVERNFSYSNANQKTKTRNCFRVFICVWNPINFRLFIFYEITLKQWIQKVAKVRNLILRITTNSLL